MKKYQVVSPHDPAQCLQALDDLLAHNPDFLSHTLFGCHAGDHTGYTIVDASSEGDVRSMLPSTLRSRARVVEVERETPQRIKSYHDEAA